MTLGWGVDCGVRCGICTRSQVSKWIRHPLRLYQAPRKASRICSNNYRNMPSSLARSSQNGLLFCSLPVAPHPELPRRSYWLLQDLWSILTRTSTSLFMRHCWRTHPGAGREPVVAPALLPRFEQLLVESKKIFASLVRGSACLRHKLTLI